MSVLGRITNSLHVHAQRTAVSGVPGGAWTYSELASAAAQAQRILGPRRARAVGLLCQKSGEAYAALLGTLLSGNHFVPLNPKLPPERLRKICALAGIELIFTDSGSRAAAEALREACPEIHELSRAAEGAFPENRAAPGLAYVMFTSGSTGEPKGVMITHANLNAVMEQVVHFHAASPEDRFSQMFDLSFDLSLGEILWCFAAGARLCPLDSLNVAALGSFLEREAITVFGCTPSVLQQLVQGGVLQGRSFPSVRFSLFCGETLSSRLATEWAALAPLSAIENLYGPTEATLYVSRHTWRGGGKVPIGVALAGCEIEVVDETLARLGSGATGELVIRGAQLSPGYLGDREGTARSFVPMPWYGGGDNRWYRTGDLGFRNSGGELEFSGRRDSRIKILGQRLELGEVEALLMAASDGEDWVVFPSEQDPYGSFQSLVAVTTAVLSVEKARSIVEKVPLPRRMQPAVIYHVPAFPLTAAGKLDRTALAKLLIDGRGLEKLR